MFDFDSFDAAKYERDEQLENGDINWLVPGVFVAFSGPLDAPKRLASGGSTWHPRQYARYCRDHGVSTVVRLNKPRSEERRVGKECPM
jgi:cell division cycle 14